MVLYWRQKERINNVVWLDALGAGGMGLLSTNRGGVGANLANSAFTLSALSISLLSLLFLSAFVCKVVCYAAALAAAAAYEGCKIYII